jgi:hypothetical protein
VSKTVVTCPKCDGSKYHRRTLKQCTCCWGLGVVEVDAESNGGPTPITNAAAVRAILGANQGSPLGGLGGVLDPPWPPTKDQANTKQPEARASDHTRPTVAPTPEVDPALVDLVTAELGLDDPQAVYNAAADLADRLYRQHIYRLADQLLAERVAAKDQNLDAGRAVNAVDFLAESEQPAPPLLGLLIAEGHNATVTAGFKAGKTTLFENTTRALVVGEAFLGRFKVDRPYRVAFLNYEMTADDLRARLRALDLGDEAAERLLVVNLRGVHLCLTSPAGRDWLTAKLVGHRPDVLIVDTYGAAAAPSVESENDNAGGRRFLTTLDQIKAAAGCPSLLMSAHTGRAVVAEGDEHARGATVLDDWADVRLVLTKDRDTGTRFLSSEGRGDFALPESALHFDANARRLVLTDDHLGTSRADTRANTAAAVVVQLVTGAPGIGNRDLRGQLREAGMASTRYQTTAISRAKAHGLVHIHSAAGNKQCHYPGQPHPDGAGCPGGESATEQLDLKESVTSDTTRY